jgi:phage baseplate assembly protein W
MANNTRTFSDLDLNFTKNPVTKDVTRRYDEDAVKNALKNLILTSNYERPFHSEIGSPIRKLLFEPTSPMLGAMLKRTIQDVINTFEPRVQLLDIICVVAADDQTIDVSIEFTILNTTAPITLDLTLQRTR